jgi:hypothetical protein
VFVSKPEDMKVIFPKLVTNIQAVQTRFNETYAAEFNRRAEQKKLAAAKLAEAKKAAETKDDKADVKKDQKAGG